MIEVRCGNRRLAYDAYHITAAFFPEAVLRGQIRQIPTDGEDGGIEIRIDERTAARIDSDDKLAAGCMLYDALAMETGRTLPWGILTGIRPTKIIRRWITDGISDDECIRRFSEDYRADREKAALALAIAKRELDYLKKVFDACKGRPGVCLYIHIPFCPSRCRYCSFASVPADRNAEMISPYLESLRKEMRAIAPLIARRPVSSVYIGGGTPTCLDKEQLDCLLTTVRDLFCADQCEWTVEAGRPDTITAEKLRVMKHAGVTRISINPQTMNDRTLERIGRGHTSAQVKEAFAIARKAGFTKINADLIAGLDGETIEDFRETLQKIGECGPDHLTVHSLAVKRASILGQQEEKRVTGAVEVVKMCDAAREWAEDHGLKPYYLYRQKNMSGNGENVGYAPEGGGCLYNILIMEEVQDIIAFGAGAVSKFVDQTDQAGNQRIVRVDNVKDPKLYIEKLEEMIQRKEQILC